MKNKTIDILFSLETDNNGEVVVDKFTRTVVLTTYFSVDVNLSMKCPLMDTIRQMAREIVTVAKGKGYKAYIKPSRFLKGFSGKMVVPAEIVAEIPINSTEEFPIATATIVSAEVFEAKFCQPQTPSQFWPSWESHLKFSQISAASQDNPTLSTVFEKAVEESEQKSNKKPVATKKVAAA